MTKFNLTAAQPASEPIPSGPFYEGDFFNTGYLSGAFGGASVRVQATPYDPGGDGFVDEDWFDIPDFVPVETKGVIQISVKAAFFRYVATSVGGSTNIKVAHLSSATNSGFGV